MGGGAWPFLVGGAICLVNSDNERDSSLLNRWRVLSLKFWVRSSSGPGSALLPGTSSGVFLFVFVGGLLGVCRRRRRGGVLGAGRVCGVGPPAVGSVLASVTTLLRGTSGVQPRDSEQ